MSDSHLPRYSVRARGMREVVEGGGGKKRRGRRKEEGRGVAGV